MRNALITLFVIPLLISGCYILPANLKNTKDFGPLVNQCLVVKKTTTIIADDAREQKYRFPIFLSDQMKHDSTIKDLTAGTQLKIIKAYNTFGLSDAGPFIYLDMLILTGPLTNKIVTYQVKNNLTIRNDQLFEEHYVPIRPDSIQYQKTYVPMLGGKLSLNTCGV